MMKRSCDFAAGLCVLLLLHAAPILTPQSVHGQAVREWTTPAEPGDMYERMVVSDSGFVYVVGITQPDRRIVVAKHDTVGGTRLWRAASIVSDPDEFNSFEPPIRRWLDLRLDDEGNLFGARVVMSSFQEGEPGSQSTIYPAQVVIFRYDSDGNLRWHVKVDALRGGSTMPYSWHPNWGTIDSNGNLYFYIVERREHGVPGFLLTHFYDRDGLSAYHETESGDWDKYLTSWSVGGAGADSLDYAYFCADDQNGWISRFRGLDRAWIPVYGRNGRCVGAGEGVYVTLDPGTGPVLRRYWFDLSLLWETALPAKPRDPVFGEGRWVDGNGNLYVWLFDPQTRHRLAKIGLDGVLRWDIPVAPLSLPEYFDDEEGYYSRSLYDHPRWGLTPGKVFSYHDRSGAVLSSARHDPGQGIVDLSLARDSSILILDPSAVVAYNWCVPELIEWMVQDGNFDNPNNWQGGTVPSEGVMASFARGGASYTVSFPNPESTGPFRVDSDDVTVLLGGNTVALGGACGGAGISLGIRSGSFSILDGTVETLADVVLHQGSDPTLRVGSGGLLNVGKELRAGSPGGLAGIRVEQGGSITTPRGRLAIAAGDIALMELDGGVITADEMTVGEAGDGTLYVKGGGLAAVDSIAVAATTGEGGLIVDSNSQLNAWSLAMSVGSGSESAAEFDYAAVDIYHKAIIGNSGIASLAIRNGARVNIPDPMSGAFGHFNVGELAGSRGALIVDGAFQASSSELWAKTIVVGMQGVGEMEVTNGASVVVDGFWVAFQGPGTVHVDGSSTFIANVVDLGPQAIVNLGPVRIGGSTGPPKRLQLQPGLYADTLIVRGEPDIAATSIDLLPGGVLVGSGRYPFDLVNGGTVNPGDAPQTTATLTVAGDFVQLATGTLEIDVAAVAEGAFDVLVADTVTLSGELRVRLLNEFSPQVGQEYEIIRAAVIEGEFDAVDTGDFRGDIVVHEGTARLVVTSGVGVDPRGESPIEFRLTQNYPNPFNPGTVISYTLPLTANVTLTVYDVLGRPVKVLASGTEPPGTYEVTFDATGLPSGLYLYRLEAGDFVETKPMVVVR